MRWAFFTMLVNLLRHSSSVFKEALSMLIILPPVRKSLSIAMGNTVLVVCWHMLSRLTTEAS